MDREKKEALGFQGAGSRVLWLGCWVGLDGSIASNNRLKPESHWQQEPLSSPEPRTMCPTNTGIKQQKGLVGATLGDFVSPHSSGFQIEPTYSCRLWDSPAVVLFSVGTGPP